MNRFIADTHFGHTNVLTFDGRPFSSTEEMEEVIVQNWNSVVKGGDTTYILGDFCWSRDQDEWCRILKRLRGEKVLLRGNHDPKQFSPALRKMFADIKDYKEINDQKFIKEEDGATHCIGRKLILCHYPILMYKRSYNPNTFMLCGHVHLTRENTFLERWRSELRRTHNLNSDSCGNVLNVGCMMPYMDYTPRTMDELEEILKEVE